MKIRSSNYRIVGFTAEVTLEELVEIGRKFALPVVEDLGSGSLVNMAKFGLPGEPTVQEAVRAGADLVTFSGDKLLGGPQAGIIIGRKDLVEQCKKNPLTRALRVDKMTLAVLESTLRLYRDERQAIEQIPTLRMIALPREVLEERAHLLATALREIDLEGRLEVDVLEGASQVGGGSLPAQDLSTFVVAVNLKNVSTRGLEEKLRGNDPPIIGRIESDRFLMDVRTLQPEDQDIILLAFDRILKAGDIPLP
jgi:L-seryl-tRNA(Ser) seleniumtransferase